MCFIFSILEKIFAKKSDQSGFALLEMTIALTILGIVGLITIPLITKYNEYSKWQKTDLHQKEVIQSLKTYLFIHQHLPCPANPLKPGIAKAICQTPWESFGIVPYRTLSLPVSSAKDGFGHFMTYAVNYYLTQSEGQDFCQNKKPVIQVLLKNNNRYESVFEPENSRPDPDQTVSDVIAFAIISYGPQGIGSFESEENMVTQRLFNSMSLEEKQNAEPLSQHIFLSGGSENTPPLTFFTQNYSSNPEHLFRHKIVWATQKYFGGFCQKKKLDEKTHKPQTLEQLYENPAMTPPRPEHDYEFNDNDHGINNFFTRRSGQSAQGMR